MLIFIFGLIVWGFIVGALARLSLPGPDPMPWYATIGLGLGGSLIGGVLARLLIGTPRWPHLRLPGCGTPAVPVPPIRPGARHDRPFGAPPALAAYRIPAIFRGIAGMR